MLAENEVTTEYTSEMNAFFRMRNVFFSGDCARLVPVMLREVYEWGSCDTWNLTCGLDSRHSKVRRKLEKAGLVAQNRRETCITDAGLFFVKKHRLSPYIGGTD